MYIQFSMYSGWIVEKQRSKREGEEREPPVDHIDETA